MKVLSKQSTHCDEVLKLGIRRRLASSRAARMAGSVQEADKSGAQQACHFYCATLD